MKYRIKICAWLLLATGAAAQVASHAPTLAKPNAPASLSKPVARVNGTVLTERDLLREEYAIFPYARQHGGQIPKDMEPGIRQGALKMIIFEELVYQETQKRKLTVPAQKLSASEAEFRKEFNSPAEYRQYVQAEFQGNEQLLRQQIKRSLLIEQFLKAEVESKSKVGPAELRAFYDKNPARFAYPESFAVQTISVMPPANATAAQKREAEQRAQEALKQAKATKNYEQFGMLAEKISDDDYRVMMGDHRWVTRNDMPKEMLGPALKMKDGEVSDLIPVGPYYVIFRLNKHVPAGKTKFEDVKPKIQKELEKNKTEHARSALSAKLQQSAKVEIL